MFCVWEITVFRAANIEYPSVFIVWAVDLLTGEDNHRAHPNCSQNLCILP